MIRFEHLSKTFKGNRVLDDVSGHVKMGKVVALLGPSGSGKSTLLRCLNLMETPDSGAIKIDGFSLLDSHTRIEMIRARMGMVFQNFNLFPHMTAIENVAFAPQKVKGIARDVAMDQAQKLLEKVGLADKGFQYPTSLSGGQKQRVAIARALAMEPDIMLFDEPTSALDPEMVKEVLGVIKDLSASGMTILLVTHEMQFAREIAHDIWFLDRGKILEVSPPAEFFTAPKSQRAKEFLEKVL